MEKKRCKNITEKLSERKFLRSNGTMAEAVMWKLLKNRQVSEARFRRQFSVGPYILDFYCPEVKLCIELDGAGHFESEGMKHDYVKDKFLASFGIKVLRFENDMIMKMQPVVLSLIEEEIRNLRQGCSC